MALRRTHLFHDKFEVAPCLTAAMNFFCNPDDHPRMDEVWNHPRRGGYEIEEGERDLEPSMLQITDGGRNGYHYIYNTKDCAYLWSISDKNQLTSIGLMVQWQYKGSIRDNNRVYWYNLTWQPAKVILAEWNQKLRSLEWLTLSVIEQSPVPGITGLPGWFTHQDIVQQYYEPDEPLVQHAKDVANMYLAGQRIYKGCGWPVLRLQEFHRELERFCERLKENEGTPRYREVLREYAGDNAIL